MGFARGFFGAAFFSAGAAAGAASAIVKLSNGSRENQVNSVQRWIQKIALGCSEHAGLALYRFSHCP